MISNREVQALIERLVRSMAETMTVLSRLEEGDLEQHSGHPCAMGGSVRKLLVHNLAHDQMHLGQIQEKRWAMDQMQETEGARLLAELIRARADIVAALVDLPDEALDQRPEGSATETSIREVIEHVLYWEQNSMEQTREQFRREKAA
jgi:uncharacterized damage-inducible protein DinB